MESGNVKRIYSCNLCLIKPYLASKAKHQKEVEISKIGGKLHDEYEDRLQKALRELRDIYDKKMEENRDDFQKRYEDRVRIQDNNI